MLYCIRMYELYIYIYIYVCVYLYVCICIYIHIIKHLQCEFFHIVSVYLVSGDCGKLNMPIECPEGARN